MLTVASERGPGILAIIRPDVMWIPRAPMVGTAVRAQRMKERARAAIFKKIKLYAGGTKNTRDLIAGLDAMCLMKEGLRLSELV